ncbi:protein RDM16-like [Trifolium pratense]|uniref:Uncharacterized protein n=2 Tax=Trifolium pratense TaxID=57577 RepID=A0ACB0KGY1_TRIPR|nr:protein RDM16-like [Trifolium pratense]CAJ2655165.1 unnamed protein product [Trifolium pratense]
MDVTPNRRKRVRHSEGDHPHHRSDRNAKRDRKTRDEREGTKLKKRDQEMEDDFENGGVAMGSPPATAVSPPPSFPIIKVSSISTTNNENNNFTMSHEVTGKFSTDGSSSSIAGKLSIHALAKAKKVLQMQKDLSEKLKRIPPPATTGVTTKAAHVLRLDAHGREIDQHGNLVVNVTKPTNLSTLKVNINKHKIDDALFDSNPHFDNSIGINKTKLMRPKRTNFLFVQEGKWSKHAESIKLKSKFGEAQAKDHKAKQAQLAKAKVAPHINPNLIEITERDAMKENLKDPIPEVEWWDVALLHSGNYHDIDKDKLKMEKITFYVEHVLPIEPPAHLAPPPPQPLKLTKQEQKKLKSQRRIAKEKERQDMIRQGVIEPPKPKLKMNNLMKVLGTEATQDPTRLEKEVRNAAAEREQAHIDRNIARKLTPAEKREKKKRKLFDDSNTPDRLVALYRIDDLSHPQTRIKIDRDAQYNELTGCAVIYDGISVVVVEGKTKTIKRYGKLMLRRINSEDSNDDKPANKCVLVWQGNVAKQNFNKFSVQACITEAAAQKVFVNAGVPHYWDHAVNYEDGGAA